MPSVPGRTIRVVGNREDLLAGARRCLAAKGYSATTVRDITQAAGGVSMAAIGYHFGSRDALMTEALLAAMDELSAEIDRAASAARADPDASPDERFVLMWRVIVESFGTHRSLWLANLEALLQAERSPALREQLVDAQRHGRRGLAATLLDRAADDVEDESVRTVGSVQMALMVGAMTQWLTDPEFAPAAQDVLHGLELVAGRFRQPTGTVPGA